MTTIVKASGPRKKSVKILNLIGQSKKSFTFISGRLLYVTISICSYSREHLHRSTPLTKRTAWYFLQVGVLVS